MGGREDLDSALKAIMAGAHAVQLVSCLLQRGPEYLEVVREEIERWMEKNEYVSVRHMRGCMNHKRSPDPAAFERANYMRILQSWRESGPPMSERWPEKNGNGNGKES